MSDPAALYESLRDEMATVLVGQEELIEGLTLATLTGGHVLLEGVPGIAKTTAANLFARATGLEYARVQMTPDLLPADITGTRVYREETGTFQLKEGPVFSNVVVADEINRATPKTQSALLESMQETQVTIDGETKQLPSPFLVIATQNPIEMEGVFALPEAQRDRFQQKLVVDIPDRDNERELLDRFDETPDLDPGSVEPVATPSEVLACKDVVGDVYVASSIKEYVIPDDLKALSGPVLAHRLVLDTDAGLRGTDPREVITESVDRVEPPTTGFVPDASETDVEQQYDSESGFERGAPQGHSQTDDA